VRLEPVWFRAELMERAAIQALLRKPAWLRVALPERI
jgi:hypothetical protein